MPAPRSVPPNVKFYVEDLEDTWANTAPYDFIYCRMLTGSIANFPKFFQQSYEYGGELPSPVEIA